MRDRTMEMLRLDIKVIANAKIECIKNDGQRFKVYLKAPAQDGKANRALIMFLAKSFKTQKQNIEIIKGLKSTLKTISIKSVFYWPQGLDRP